MRSGKTVLLVIIIFSLSMLMFAAAAGGAAQGPPSYRIELAVGSSMIMSSPSPFKSAELVNPEIADAKVLNPQQVYLTGRAPGTTSLILRDESNRAFAVYEVYVQPDVGKLKDKLHEMLPAETGLKVIPTSDKIALTGTVSSPTDLGEALQIAESYAPQKVLNMLQVGGVQQVMLEIRVSEMSRTLMRQLGVNFNFISQSGTKLGISLLGQLTQLPSSGWPANPLVVSSSVDAIFNFFSDKGTWTVFIDGLKEQGLLKVLAEPTLVTLSGQTANFLAGGEYPIPVPQGLGAVAIDYKQYGVMLNFTPTVLGNKISMQVSPEVSELDFTDALVYSGFTVPAITTRKLSTTVELADGQSFAVAGLLSDQVNETIQKYPILGDIPILGTLFRSEQFQKNETELVVIVTPHLVKPLEASKQVLPGDNFVPPGELEFYLLGNPDSLGGGKKQGAAETTGSMEGAVGHLLP